MSSCGVHGVFLARNFWENERPSSTENQTESSNYPESQAETVVPRESRDPPITKLEKPLENLENIELKSKIRKLEYEIERTKKEKRNQELTDQAVINQLKRQNIASESEKMELENELIECKSRIDQLKYENQRLREEKCENCDRNAKKCESLEKRNNALIKCENLKCVIK